MVRYFRFFFLRIIHIFFFLLASTVICHHSFIPASLIFVPHKFYILLKTFSFFVLYIISGNLPKCLCRKYSLIFMLAPRSRWFVHILSTCSPSSCVLRLPRKSFSIATKEIQIFNSVTFIELSKLTSLMSFRMSLISGFIVP